MCDYSLEAYRSRPAFEGEQYVTSRFTSGSIGFIAPGDPMTAICMAYDMRLRLENVPQSLQGALGVKDTETVTFARLDGELFQDGVRFANGAQVTLQRLGPGVKASVEDALKAPRRERQTEFAT
jgi:hypothetical protein